MFTRFILILIFLTSSKVLAGDFNRDSLVTEINVKQMAKPDPWIAKDKAVHFVGSFLMTGLTSKGVNRFGELNRKKSVNIGVSVSFSLGLAKEIYDHSKPQKSFSYKDLAADLMGCLLGYFVFK